jgi:hypothetical protein
MEEIYISTDVEADGPIPGQNSMLSFGPAAYTKDKALLYTVEAHLECLPGKVVFVGYPVAYDFMFFTDT